MIDLTVLDSVARDLQSNTIQLAPHEPQKPSVNSIFNSSKGRFAQLLQSTTTTTANQSQPINNNRPTQKDTNKWHEIPLMQLTPEIKRDLRLLQMRDTLDPKRFYKKSTISRKLLDKSTTTARLQIGTIVDDPLHRFSRIVKRERRNHIVDELIADTARVHYFKEKVRQQAARKLEASRKGWHSTRLNRIGRNPFKDNKSGASKRKR